MRAGFAGLSTFDPFPDGNASQVDTKARFGKQAFARKSGSHPGSIFSSSCYGFADPIPLLLAHSGWVLVVGNLVG